MPLGLLIGQLSVLLSRLKGNAKDLPLPGGLIRRIELIQRKADSISNAAIPSIIQKQPTYFNSEFCYAYNG